MNNSIADVSMSYLVVQTSVCIKIFSQLIEKCVRQPFNKQILIFKFSYYVIPYFYKLFVNI